MEAALAAIVGLFFAAAIYLMLSKHIIRMLLGVALFGNAVNLLIFTAGRVASKVAPIIPEGLPVAPGPTANPLPQALILTAIVISFSFFAFLLVLAYRAYQDLGSDDTDGMRLAEPPTDRLPPMGY
jgi:multicomponent Na+:H+ antiporter subunit C